jgi:hypothetical protein
MKVRVGGVAMTNETRTERGFRSHVRYCTCHGRKWTLCSAVPWECVVIRRDMVVNSRDRCDIRDAIEIVQQGRLRC